MQGIVRTWHCLSSRCAKEFDSWENNPSCPTCRCCRVAWVPAGGHIGKAAKTGDAELRALADVFRMTDINSAEEGRAAKKVNLPQALPSGGPVHTFAPGFSAPVERGAGAMCVPTSDKVDFKVKATPGSRLVPDSGFAKMNVAGNTTIEARHRP